MNRIVSRSALVAVVGSVGVALLIGCTAKNSSKGSETKTSISMLADTGAGMGRDRFGDGGPGFGTPLTGADYDKAVKAATDKYPGTVERAERRDDGTIIVHVITKTDEVRVVLDKDFVVTGTEQGGPGGPRDGRGPGGPGFGTPLTGADYDKAAKAATDKYPGTVERAERRSDGTIVVHVITKTDEVHVVLDKDFVVTGVEQGGPGGPGGDMNGGQPRPTA